MPTAARLNNEQLLDRLAEVFRRYGFEGASLTTISEATGLQRASLYHRFPGGKEQMAEAVLDRIDQRFEQHVLSPLFADGDLSARIKDVGKRLREFFADGERSCVFDTLSLDVRAAGHLGHVTRSMQSWIGAFAAAAAESGLTASQARRCAEDGVVQIQGALVVARVTGDHRPFKRVIRSLEEILTTPSS